MPKLKPITNSEGEIIGYHVLDDQGRVTGLLDANSNPVNGQNNPSTKNPSLNTQVIVAFLGIITACIGIFSLQISGVIDLNKLIDNSEVQKNTPEVTVTKLSASDTPPMATQTPILATQTPMIITATPNPVTPTPHIITATPVSATAFVPTVSTRGNYCDPPGCEQGVVFFGRTFDPQPPSNEEWWYAIQNIRDGKYEFVIIPVTESYACNAPTSTQNCAAFGYYSTYELALSEFERECGNKGTTCLGVETYP